MSISQEKRKQAIEFFIKIGLFIPYDSVELYHGRTRQVGEEGEWVVDPNFNNSNDATGHKNINGLSALSTGKKNVAEKFAKERSKYESGTPELHKIESLIDDALIFNEKFDFNSLSEKDRELFFEYVKWLTPAVSKYAPVKFEYREKANIVYDVLKKYIADREFRFLSYKDVDQVFARVSKMDSSITKDLVQDIVGGWNAKLMLLTNPKRAISHFALERNQKDRESFVVDKKTSEKAPLNLDYIASWLISLGIVGVKAGVWSATLGENIEAYYLFDLNSVNTRSAKAQKMIEIMENYSGIIDLLGNFDTKNNEILNVLTEPSPENIIDTLQKDDRYAHFYNASAKVWEGFSVGEHTETCLRIFDSGISKDVPKELHPYIRLAIICHDIGKGMPRDYDESQLWNNIKYANEFMNSIGVPKEIIQIIETIMKAQEYTSDYYINGNENAEKSLFLYLTSQLQKIYGVAPSDEQVKGLMSMCKALQICDSGSYTRYAVTRDKKTGRYYKNGNDRFSASFEEPTNLTKDKLRFKNDPTM